MTNPLDAWIDTLSLALGLDPGAVPRDLLLDVARDAAHGVARPAAPLTTFLVGLAAGREGGAADVAVAAAIAQHLATSGHASIDSINLGTSRTSPDPRATRPSGIGKHPVDGPVEVREPGPKHGGLGSGIVGDFIGDQRHHGGTDQAVYAVAREDLDAWSVRLGRELPNGFFGENLTTRGIDVNAARVGERWRLGDDVVVQVTVPRIPCNTFRGWVGEKGWLKTFTEVARPGAYLRVVEPGRLTPGARLEIVHRPAHDVTITLAYKAILTDHHLRARLWDAGDDLPDELRELAEEATGRGQRTSSAPA